MYGTTFRSIGPVPTFRKTIFNNYSQIETNYPMQRKSHVSYDNGEFHAQELERKTVFSILDQEECCALQPILGKIFLEPNAVLFREHVISLTWDSVDCNIIFCYLRWNPALNLVSMSWPRKTVFSFPFNKKCYKHSRSFRHGDMPKCNSNSIVQLVSRLWYSVCMPTIAVLR